MKTRSFKQYFITGLLVWLPMGITVWVLTWLVGLLDGIFLAVLYAADSLIPGMHKLAEALRGVPGLGVILVALVILATGVFVANMFGQWWLRKWDSLMNRIPVVRSIYTSVKQVADTLFSGSGNAHAGAGEMHNPTFQHAAESVDEGLTQIEAGHHVKALTALPVTVFVAVLNHIQIDRAKWDATLFQ